MGFTLDGQDLFNKQAEIESESFCRELVERTAAGIDGIVSIDLGHRGRIVKQTGVLRAKSISDLGRKISVISSFLDGQTHMLVTEDGEVFDNLRMDAFEVRKRRTTGSCIYCDYEIVYKQLVA